MRLHEIESKLTWIDYLMGHFTKANVESFVNENARSWGTQYMFIRMDWGYRKFLEAEVVALALCNNSSEMGFQHQALDNGTLVRKQSPPLGIPLAAMDDMQNTYSKYIQDIVRSDLREYIPIAYVDEESELANRLLEAVSLFYIAGNETNNEVTAIDFHLAHNL
jgi:hypothetical protein